MTRHSLFPGGHGRITTVEHHNSLMDDLERKVSGRFDDEWRLAHGPGGGSTSASHRSTLVA